VIGNVALVAPAGIDKPDGTPTDGKVLIRVTETPSLGAGPLSVTVPTVLAPPATVEGLIVIPLRVMVLTLRVADTVPPGAVAVILAGVECVTTFVLIMKLPVVDPAPITTDLGTDATVLLLARVTFNPAEGAGPERVKVPRLFAPPPTVLGFKLSELKIDALIVRLAETDAVPTLAVTLATAVVPTGLVLQSKVAEVAPEGMTTEPGPPHAELDDVRVMFNPLAGAGEAI